MTTSWKILTAALALLALLARGHGDDGADAAFCAFATVSRIPSTGRTLWTVDDNVLETHELKDVVYCAEDGDAVMLNASKTIVPKTPLTISKSVAIEGGGSQPSVLSCPDGEGLFIVQDANFTLRNVAIIDCRVEGDFGVIDVHVHSNASDVKTLLLDKAQLRDINVAATSPSGCIHVRNPDAVEVVMKDTSFRNINSPPSRMAGRNTFLNVRLVIGAVVGEDEPSGFFSFPPNSMARISHASMSRVSGSVMHMNGGALTIEDSRFFYNRHRLSNGTFNVYRTDVTITRSDIRYNRYFSGSCITADTSSLLINSSRLYGNSAQCSGGCLRVTNLKRLKIVDSIFASNRASQNKSIRLNKLQCHGGAIDIRPADSDSVSDVSIDKSRFIRNWASLYGGGLSVNGYGGALTAHVKVTNTEFSRNNAVAKSGAAMFFFWIRHSTIMIQNCTFSRHYATFTSGPYLEEGENNTMSIDRCRFNDNIGYSVGLRRATFSPSTIRVSNCHFVGKPMGGYQPPKENRNGVRVDAAAASTVEIWGCTFRRFWTRGLGAAVAINGLRNFTMWDCSFIDNSALEGGAVRFRSVNAHALIQNCTFERNEGRTVGGAVKSDTITVLKDCRFYSNEAAEKGGAVVMAGAQLLRIEGSAFEGNKAKIGGGLYTTSTWHLEVVGNDFFNNTASLYGGAIAFQRTGTPRWNFSSGIVATTIRGNAAAVGGNLLSFRCQPPRAGGIYIAKDNHNVFVDINNTAIEGNRARKAGGGVYLDALRVAKFDGRYANTSVPGDDPRALIKDNRVESGYGKQVATSSEDFNVLLHYENGTVTNPPSTHYTLDPWTSGDRFPYVRVVMLDAFGSELSLTKTSDIDESHVPGGLGYYDNYVRAQMRSDETHFISDTLTRDVSTGCGTLHAGRPFDEPGNYSLFISVEGVAEKVIIDIVVRDCRINERTALNGTYCERCDRDHYNFDPKNERCLMCPNNANCSSKWILPKKGYWNVWPMSPKIDRCILDQACPHEVLDESEVDALIVPSSVQNGVTSTEYNSLLCKDGHEGPLCGSCAEGWGQSVTFSCGPCRNIWLSVSASVSDIVTLFLLTVLEIVATRKASRLTYKTLSRMGLIRSRSERSLRGISRILEGTSGRNAEQAEELELNFQELVKMTVNLLQMVSLSNKLGVSWTATLMKLYRSWDLIGSTTSKFGSYGFDCILPYKSTIPRSVAREILAFLLPVVVLILISIYWLTKKSRNRDEMKTALRLCFLTAVILANASYISIVESSLNAFYCVPVHSLADDPDTVTKHWAIDTAVLCKSKSHWIVLGIVGIPGIVFSVVFPIFVIVFLVYLRNKKTLDSDWAQETMGILIGGYKENYVYWDAVVLLRKAMMSTVLAFAYNLGGTLQGLLAIGVLLIFLILQMSTNPFKQELGDLNGLESASLTVTVFTLLAGVILDNERMTSGEVKWMLVAMVLVCNVALMAYLFLKVAWIKMQLIKFELEAKEVNCGDGSLLAIVKAWLRHYLSGCRLRRRRRRNDDDDTDPTTSNLISGDDP